jgi:hypothetical protein
MYLAEAELKTTGPPDKLKELREEENALLLENGFEPVGSNDLLWLKECVCYGREAALQEACRRKVETEGFRAPFPIA